MRVAGRAYSIWLYSIGADNQQLSDRPSHASHHTGRRALWPNRPMPLFEAQKQSQRTGETTTSQHKWQPKPLQPTKGVVAPRHSPHGQARLLVEQVHAALGDGEVVARARDLELHERLPALVHLPVVRQAGHHLALLDAKLSQVL